MKERLQKILSRAGFGSRRDCEKIIFEGRVYVNGKLVTIGASADQTSDQIKVDGKVISNTVLKEKCIIVHKPKNVLSDIKKRDDRKTVREFVPDPEYLFIVGRLDYDSEGLVLLTNNGEIANRLTHPRYEHEKEYAVLVKEAPSKEKILKWESGIEIENKITAPAHVEILETGKIGTWLRVVLREGRNREIREICRILGLRIKRLVRVRIETIELGNLQAGSYRILNENEVQRLKKAIAL